MKSNHVPDALGSMSQVLESCCVTTEDGAQMCVVPQNGQAASCSCSCSSVDPIVSLESLPRAALAPSPRLWQKIRSGVLFAVACIASPCCTPLIVPILLTLLAGTPVAVWMGHHLGWVYGGLTLVSIISLVMALRWTSQRPTSNRATLRPLDIPVSAPKIGDKAHAE